MTHSSNVRGIIYMVLAGLSFVSCDSFLKLMLADVPPLQSLVLRGVSATVWCFALLVVMRQLKDLPKLLEFWTFMRTLAEVVAVSAFILGLAKVPLADITAIYQVAPLFVLAGASLIPVSLGMTSWLYLAAISVLDLIFLGYAIALVRNYSDALARSCFRYSILYLTLLFAALFADRLIMS